MTDSELIGLVVDALLIPRLTGCQAHMAAIGRAERAIEALRKRGEGVGTRRCCCADCLVPWDPREESGELVDF